MNSITEADKTKRIIERLQKTREGDTGSSYEIAYAAIELKDEGYEPKDIAYILFHGLNASGESLVEALVCDAAFGLAETARAIFDGLLVSPIDLAKMFFEFNTGHRAKSTGEAVLETANILYHAGIFVADEEYNL
jgi:hypothetical protein